jgi:uncharacterized protein YehS (DUF1456 family)
MIRNDIIRRLQFALSLRNRDVQDLFKLGGLKLSDEEVRARLGKDTDEGFVECEVEALTSFLDGLIIQMRGAPSPTPGAPAPTRMLASSNNIVLRKLRIALDLREEGMLDHLERGGFTMSKHELSALFRKQGHKHYREAGDQVLRYFLAGVHRMRRQDEPEPDEAEQTVEAVSKAELTKTDES